jgi:hypothetical protein
LTTAADQKIRPHFELLLERLAWKERQLDKFDRSAVEELSKKESVRRRHWLGSVA